MKKLTYGLFTLSLLGLAHYATAANLLEVFHQAQSADPTYAQAKANYLSARSQLAQSRSYLLPNLDLTGTWTSTQTNQDANVDILNRTINGTNVMLALTQPLFDWRAIRGYQKVKLDVKSAAATYGVAAEDLITRTATAYFTVLKDQDLLRAADANKRQLYRSYQVAHQRYKVGLDAIAAAYDAKASYDGAKAAYIASENTLANDKEALRQITGQLYPSLSRLKENFPLVNPTPASIDDWSKAALQQNLQLLATRYATQAARAYIKVQSAQHLPTVGFTAGYNRIDQNFPSVADPGKGGTALPERLATTFIGLQGKLPLIHGGLYRAQTKTAEYDYQAAVANMENVHRATLASVRNSYLSVIAEISQIEADRQAIKSAKASLASYEAGYKVGTQTIVDVLQAQSRLYQNKQTYASDRFNYVINTFNLKEAAGILSVNDLRQVNSWLTVKPLVTAKPTSPRAVRSTSKTRRVSRSAKNNRSLQHTTAKATTAKSGNKKTNHKPPKNNQ